jgi:hypothetical protein
MRIHIILPDELVAEIDALAGPGKRSEYITDVLETKVRSERLRETIRRGAGILRDEDYPHWSTPEKIAAWVRDGRSIPSSFEKNRDKLSTGHQRHHRVAEE